MSGTEAIINTLMGVDRGRNAAWVDRALCRGDIDPDIWFPNPPNTGWSHAEPSPKKKRGHRDKGAREIYAERVAFAIAICDDCPVKAACLADAESRNEKHGVWGGRDFYQTRTQREAKAS